MALNPLAEVQASISSAVSILSDHMNSPQRTETTSRLLVGLGIGTGRLGKHEDEVA